MKKKVLFAAMVLVALASCSDETFIGDVTTPQDNSPSSESNAIVFASASKGITRADIYGEAAAGLLGDNFYVTGTKGTEPNNSPTTMEVFDNYLVHYDKNTAGKTTSNTANWEYVGIEQAPTSGSPTVANRVKLSSTSGPQTIKYWDYSVPQYDFLAFSTGTFKAVAIPEAPTVVGNDEIGVTAMKYGSALASNGVAYTFDLPSVNALKNAFISDITEVPKASYGKEVQLKFKNLGSKVRIALYETVPGYSVRDVKFYRVDGTNTDLGTATKYDDSYLIGADNNSFPTKAKINVYFPHVGSTNDTEADYDIAAATVTPASGTYETFKTFGALTDQLVNKERAEKKWNAANKEFEWDNTNKVYVAETGKVFLGRDLPHATFAGNANAAFYETVFPVSTAYALTLRVDYTLVPIDGATEVINVYGAKAVVPDTYTKWLPNYAYTYIFKISDNTNGWTSTVEGDPSGLFPITFDAVVAEATDATGEQTTITTVAAPTITTYQQNHNPNKNGEWISTNEYSKATGKNIYVQVMDNSTTTPTLKDDLSGDTPEGKAKSLLYKLDDDHANSTEAIVMDALKKRTATYSGDAAEVKGRNGLVLTKSAITNKVNNIVNGVDDNPIDVSIEGEKKSKAAMITITGDGSLGAGTYAYVYDYTTTSRTEIEEYQPIAPGTSYIESDASTKTFYTITTTQLNGITAESATVDLTATGANNFLYFSKTENGTGTTTYSYISIVGKTSLPAGVVKIEKSSVGTAVGNTAPVTATFYFDKYFSNDGSYAVKVIKVVN